MPTVQGQYLIKDLLLFTAAMIIGGSMTRNRRGRGGWCCGGG